MKANDGGLSYEERKRPLGSLDPVADRHRFARQNAIGLTTVRGEIKAGRLVARKGRRTIIAAEDAKAWQERLPRSPIFNGNSKAVQSAVAAAEPASEAEVVTQHD
jgi:hypothetical protein